MGKKWLVEVGAPTPMGAVGSIDWAAFAGHDVVVSSRLFGDERATAVDRGR
jgi:hypothetical protein